MSGDFFEVDRVIEDLAKSYSTAFATAWFRIMGKKKPSKEEFRAKVVEFMNHFEYTLSTFPETPAANGFRSHAKQALTTEISRVVSGENKEVEKRYRYFVEYS
jgi:hypothetical protein